MLRNKIFEITNDVTFKKLALETFKYQAEKNWVYKKYIELLKVKVEGVEEIYDIPFLPIDFFKTHVVSSNTGKAEKIFLSSGTTASVSKHYIYDLSLYEQSFTKGFQYFYGDIKDYCILALLPSYLERQDSSLIYMVDCLIKSTHNPESGFYLYNMEELVRKLERLNKVNQKVLLLGVSFALIDLAEKFKFKLNDRTIIMETGGMKGRRKEIVREELHEFLRKSFGVKQIHSEYGMTELLSQAYSKNKGLFKCTPWMKVLIRDINDPLNIASVERTGGINIIDLANINSCSFIATQDLGKMYSDNSFEVLGRIDNSDIRGCSLLIN